MNFAVPFHRNFIYLNDPVQLNIKYKPKIEQLNNFIEEYGGTHRINLIISNFNQSEDFPIIQALLNKFTDFKIVICLSHYSKELQDFFVQKNIPHYYNELVTTWDKFQGFLNLKVTDIFIAEEIAFSAKILHEFAYKKGIGLRSYCNVCESAWDQTESIKSFFIRPQDIDLYDGLFDTIEFFVSDREVNKINVLYEVYTRSKTWFGALNEIIEGYQGSELNRCFIFPFGMHRLNCGHRCMKDPSNPCRICDRIAQLSVTLEHQNLAVQIDKK